MNTNTILYIIAALCLGLYIGYFSGKSQPDERYNRLLEQNALLKLDSANNRHFQDSSKSVIDSLTLLKSKTRTRYEQVEVPYYYTLHPDFLDSLLSRAYDSLYIHRFSKHLTKANGL